MSVPVAVYGGWRERREADGDILCAIRFRGAVADPLAGGGHDGLARVDVDDAGRVLDAEEAAKHDGNLLEFRALTRLLPSRG